MCKQRQELERLCEKVGGCRVAKHKSGSGHFLIVGTDKDWSVTAPSTPSDWRGMKNMEAELRRRVHVEEDRTPDTDSLLFANLLLGQIIPDADQPRKDAEQTDLESLAASILKSGVLEPILVMPIDDKQYRIIAGERRFLAATLALGLKDSPVAASSACQGYDFTRIPARIFAPMSKMDILRIQMTENLSREDMSQLDTGRALLKFVEAGLSKERIARELGRSPTWVKGMLAKCSPEASEIAAKIGILLEGITSSDMLRLVGWSRDAEKKVILERLEKRVATGESFNRTMIDEEFERHNISSLFPSLSADDWSMKDLRMLEEFYTSQDAGKNALAEQMLETGLPLSAMLASQAVANGPVKKTKGTKSGKRAMTVPKGFPVYFPEAFIAELLGDDRRAWTQENVMEHIRRTMRLLYIQMGGRPQEGMPDPVRLQSAMQTLEVRH
ncbi:MAG: ParB/RepB/Spo0J family partition protein [Acidithiobacillus sp.]